MSLMTPTNKCYSTCCHAPYPNHIMVGVNTRDFDLTGYCPKCGMGCSFKPDTEEKPKTLPIDNLQPDEELALLGDPGLEKAQPLLDEWNEIIEKVRASTISEPARSALIKLCFDEIVRIHRIFSSPRYVVVKKAQQF